MPKETVISCNPLILVVDELFSEELAEKLIKLTSDQQRRARTGAGSKTFITEERTNTTAHISQSDNAIAMKLCEIASVYTRLPIENSEVVQVLRYQKDQKFDPHFDAFRVRTPDGQEAMLHGGQRIFTTLLYLNTPQSGGETLFPKLNVAVRPKLGRLLMFANTLPGTNLPHPNSLHSGTPVESDDPKWVASIWWRERATYRPQAELPSQGQTRYF